MLKLQEKISKPKPLHLFKANINSEKDAFFLITDSDKYFWMMQEPTDWEKVTIDNIEVLRDGGSTTYYFNGKEFNELYIPSRLQKNKAAYISGKSACIFLENITLSEKKLKEIDITDAIVELDLSDIPVSTSEKTLSKKKLTADGSREKNLSRLAQHNLLGFFDALSKEDSSETSAESNTLNEFVKLKM